MRKILFIIATLVILAASCNSRQETHVSAIPSNDTTVYIPAPTDTPAASSEFRLAFASEPRDHTIRSLAGLHPTKHYHNIIERGHYSPDRNDVIINGQRIVYFSSISDDSIDYIGPFDPKSYRKLESYEDSTVAERDTLLFYNSIRNYVVRFNKDTDQPIDTIEISRDRIFRAERDFFDKKYGGSFYCISDLKLCRVEGDTIEFHLGFYMLNSDFGDLYRYRITNTGDTFFIDEDYYKKYGNAPFGIEPEDDL